MSVMFEVYYQPPANPQKESALTARVSTLGGRLTYREPPGDAHLPDFLGGLQVYRHASTKKVRRICQGPVSSKARRASAGRSRPGWSNTLFAQEKLAPISIRVLPF